jgi:hypothetical protein
VQKDNCRFIDPQRVAAHQPAVWQCTPRWGGVAWVIGPFEAVCIGGTSGATADAYVNPRLRHKHGIRRDFTKSLRQNIGALILEFCPNIFEEQNVARLADRIRDRLGTERDLRRTVGRALRDLRAANRNPR